eukprot:jgi/Botrbrau1/6395/Bobra.49_1s0013.1
MDPLHDRAFDRALQVLTGSHHLPRMVVIDLDLTQVAFDRESSLEHVSLIPEAMGTLAALKRKGVPCALCGRSEQPQDALSLISRLRASALFDIQRMYQDTQQQFQQLAEIQKEAGVDFEEMMFFDDGRRNIQDIARLGVTCAAFADSLKVSDLERALEVFTRAVFLRARHNAF